MTNPFLGYGRVVTDERLIGREVEKSHIREIIQSKSGSLSIIGEPRIGKTSLVYNEFQNQCNKDFLCSAWITLSTISSPALVFYDLQEKIIDALKSSSHPLPEETAHYILSEDESTYNAYKKIRRFLKILFSKGFRTLCILDEFDAVTEYPDAKQFIQSLRELIDFPEQTGFFSIFISRRSLYHLERQLSGVSNLDGVCEKLYVKSLSLEEVNIMALRCRDFWSLNDKELVLLFDFTGGHPYLSEMTLCRAWNRKDISIGIQNSLSDVYSYYEGLRQLLNEDKLFDQLLQITVGPCIATDVEKIERLLKYGIVVKQQSEGSSFSYKGWSEHFQSYLDKISRANPIWADWSSTETLLRGILGERFREKHGENWIDHLENAHEKAKDVFKACRKNMKKEMDRFGSFASTNILDYTYPMDLWTLIECDWPLFQPLLKKDKNYWRARFETLSKVRTPIAHSRETCLPLHLIQEAQAYCQEIKQMLSSQHSS
ncbi:MAG: hypothetical protein A2W23_02840 [Planctomycetes bacterium RBG_16_43_13]|nr:MAG: hypothetical protein A2W23_02840 [Planctomycetes bacterium RBG_16_43_13]